VLGLTELTLDPNTGVITNSTNLTILNFLLLRLGPMNEERLVQVLMCSQVSVLFWSVGILIETPQGSWKSFRILRQVWHGMACLRRR